MKNVHPGLISIALEHVEGSDFESFAQDFLSALEGYDFTPLGGTRDGGADGLYQYGEDRTYYQFSRQENHRDKIRKTVKRLRDFKRDVKRIYYLSSRSIPHLDKEEDSLSDELDVFVKVRDKKYIISHINDTTGTIAAYNNHLARYTQFLEHVGQTTDQSDSPHIKDPSVYVFLQHEITDRRGDRKLVHSVTDSMILWALSGTDPDKGIFMNEGQIEKKIFDHFPWTLKLFKGHIQKRLEKLGTKGEAGRKIRWYKKEKKYCLPYETRLTIKEENQSDESLKISFMEELRLLASKLSDADDGECQKIAELSSDVVNSIFEKQGLLFSRFISSDDQEDAPSNVADCIDYVLTEADINGTTVEQYREYIETIIRKVFYHGSQIQREYLINLSRTYVLLFTLRAEPKIIEYFSNMGTSFRLFLGSDILVKALSERYLAEENQTSRNLLKMASATGISMLLSECVLEEIYTHIKATYYEFRNSFSEMEPYITEEIARNSGKILIRSYFYARQEGHIRNWQSYLGQFITYSNIERPEGREELKKYLLSEYHLSFMENTELESVSPEDDVKALTKAMLDNDDKKNEALAYNTALQVYGIYGLRSKNKETTTSVEYGFKTWWMTNQRRVLKHTKNIVAKKQAEYMMRPDYILNFIAMSPECDKVRKSFKEIFPSIFGIQLGHRLQEELFKETMSKVNEWKGHDSGRITTLVSDLSDKLKADRLKRYEHTVSEDRW